MPTINSTEEVYSAGITLAGHVYSKAAVHHFIRSLAIVLAFILFSYLALVTFPSLAARKYPSPPALRNVSTRIVDTGASQVDISIPERPFRPRPRPIPMDYSHSESQPSPPLKYSPLLHPHHQQQYAAMAQHAHSLSPLAYAALENLHATADTLVGAHPFAVSFISRSIHSPPERKIVFPWVHPDASFGLIRSGFLGSGPRVRMPIRAVALCKPRTVGGGKEKETVERADSTASSTTSHSTSQPAPVAPRNKNRMRDNRLLYNNFGTFSNKVDIKTRRRSKNLVIKTKVATTTSNAHAGVKSASAGHGKNVKRAHRVGVIFEGRRDREGVKENVEPREAGTGIP
ncbi:hypothetical protein FB45DRAFT_1072153 [Roridomyces roridus]|uniref:Uncharacterized protein n=1 Tax=Roridomyces roridus TaxID=1738132 RepID=A0AAD7F5R2_9AGAR|nr:hypothetical protein FB45DRAFT_1072153 [Roridomyces roridus]